MPQRVAGIAATHPLLLGEQIAGGDTAFGAGFQDATTGRFERQVLIGGRRNQAIQSWIVEDRPPMGVGVFEAFQSGIVRVDPVLRSHGGGSRVVWSYLEPILDPRYGACTS